MRYLVFIQENKIGMKMCSRQECNLKVLKEYASPKAQCMQKFLITYSLLLNVSVTNNLSFHSQIKAMYWETPPRWQAFRLQHGIYGGENMQQFFRFS